jgi:D-alanyl-D-alanine dipeptidase
VSGEESRAQSAELSLNIALSSEVSRAESSEVVLQGNIDTEKNRIDAILSASTFSADSFYEIVQLINSIDTDSDTAFAAYVLSNDAALSAEISRANSSELSLTNKVSTETSRAESAEASLATLVSNEISSEHSHHVSAEASIDLAIFEIYGYKPNNATFVKGLNIKTEISNEMATMITVGAQANGSAVGEDATAFSKWNEGLIDRIIPEKNDTKSTAPKPEEEKKPDYEDTIEEYEDFVKQMSNYEFTDNIDYFGSILTNFLDYNQAKKSETEKKQSPTVGFIPINLGLEIVGLSGMKIYQKFSINQTFLPYNYPNTIEFLVKGLSQKVDVNGWTTSIESLSIPKDITSGASPTLPTTPNTFTSTGAVGSGAANAVSTGGTKAKYSVSNIPDSIDKCAVVKGNLNESIVTSKIQNAYSTVKRPNYVKGKQSFIAKLEKAYDNLVKQGIKLNIGDSLRSYDVQKSAYITNEAARQSNSKLPYKAHPCQGYHVRGQALDLNQTAEQKKDIQSHGKIYKALYDAGLRRINGEWWHWSVGETDHDINKKFPGDISNYNRY